MDSPFEYMVLAFVVILSGVGGVALMTDFRHFSEFQTDCEKLGYVQNSKVRILCQVEQVEKAKK